MANVPEIRYTEVGKDAREVGRQSMKITNK